MADDKILQDLLARQDVVQMKTVTGETDFSISVATDRPGDSRTEDFTAAYIVPSGYVRWSANFESSHASGDFAHSDWSTEDPHNGNVYLRVHCSGVGGKARAAVNNVYAAKPAVLLKLHEMG